jgi:GNAT superfamily N-acetyltransferase
MDAVHIRHATIDDAEMIADLHARSWQSAYRGIYTARYLDEESARDRQRVWRDRFDRPDASRAVIIADDGRMIAGFICIAAREDTQWGSLIDNLHVDPSRKRTGIGGLLLREGARWLVKHHPDAPVYLWVLERNTNARGFYERLGATNAETLVLDTADGAANSTCRYTWRSPADLFASCSADRS